MGYSSFKEAPKDLITSDQIGSGQIDLSHLAPSLFLEIRSISQHTHSGVKSRKINIRDLGGDFGSAGFYMFSSDSTKKYQITIDSALNAFVLTQV